MTAVDCGCCTTAASAIPAEIENRPGLSAIAYRIGTFATFRQAITDQLSHTAELAGLTARVSEDYTITAIELWSAVADVLTFYQERTANEAFLRTATLRDSILRLVRLIGYELAPGAAATTQLAFTLDNGATALIPVGTRVKSVPGEGDKPQTYETLSALEADARLNKLRLFPRPSPVSPSAAGQGWALAAPDAEAVKALAALAPGDRVMLFAPGAVEVLTVRELKAQDDLLTVAWVAPIAGAAFVAAFDASDQTCQAYRLGRSFRLFGFDAPPSMVVAQQATPGDLTTTFLTVASTDYSLQGDGSASNQLSLDARYDNLKPGATLLAVATVAATTVAIPCTLTAVAQEHASRNATPPSGPAVTALSGTVTRVTLSSLSGMPLSSLLSAGGDIRNVTVFELIGPALRFWPFGYPEAVAASDVYLPGRRVGWSSLQVGRTIEKVAYKGGTEVSLADFDPGRPVLLTDAKADAPISAAIASAALIGSGVALEPTATDGLTLPAIGFSGDQATPATVLVSATCPATMSFPAGSRRELAVTIGALPTQTINLDPVILGGGAIANVASALQMAIRIALPGAPAFTKARVWEIPDPSGHALAIAPGVPGDEVAFAASTNDPGTVVLLGLDAARVRFLDGLVSAPIGPLATGGALTGYVRATIGTDPPHDVHLDFPYAGAVNLAAAMRSQLGLNTLITEDDRVLILPRLPAHEPRSHVHLRLDLDDPVSLATGSAVLLGNVAPASHGETVRNEIVGDGDASQAFQLFTLKKKPVTYVPSAATGGVSSSLSLLVNGVLWKEVPTLYGARPQDQVYVTRMADDGALSVRFGEGVTGSRPDTGRQNIVARYRYGTGLAGRVGAGRLTTLLDRPTGVKGVANLLATDGGADPEVMDRARIAAPGSVRTFGRAVSLHDFEDTTLMAGEVAKASATWVWNGERRAIHLTVAAQGGATFSADGLARIMATLATERDPNHKLLIANYAAVAVRLQASIIVNPRYVNDDVLAAVRAAVLFALSFDQRRFAQPVYLSDIYRVMQKVDGVVAVDLDLLNLKSTDAGFRAAHGVDDTLPQPQARLLMLPARPGGTPGTVLPAELAIVEVPSQDVVLSAGGGIVL
jgi:Baseplate J-like protein